MAREGPEKIESQKGLNDKCKRKKTQNEKPSKINRFNFAAMFQKSIAVFFLMLLNLQLFSQGFYYLSYELNKKAFIARCENKKRPQLHCNGQCVLMKKLRAQEKQEQKYPEKKLLGKSNIVSSKSFYPSGVVPFDSAQKDQPLFIPSALSKYPSEIFHPPSGLL